jgi:hypothetical protein
VKPHVRYLENAVLAAMPHRALLKSSKWQPTTAGSSEETRSPGTAGEGLDTIQAFDKREELVLEPTLPSNSDSETPVNQDSEERSSCEVCGNVITLVCEDLKSQTYPMTQYHSYRLSEVESKAANGCPDCVVISNIAKSYNFDVKFHLSVGCEYYDYPRRVRLSNSSIGFVYLYRTDGEFSFYMIHV